jgi:hypothetical protein
MNSGNFGVVMTGSGIGLGAHAAANESAIAIERASARCVQNAETAEFAEIIDFWVL